MPNCNGVVLFDGNRYGIFVDGAVIYASEERGYVVMENVSEGAWNAWGTLDNVRYPNETGEENVSE